MLCITESTFSIPDSNPEFRMGGSSTPPIFWVVEINIFERWFCLRFFLFEDLICWNDRYIQLYLLAVSIDIYQVEYQISRTDIIILQKQVSRFSNNTKTPICQLCSKEIEDILHFIVRCSALQKVRSPFLTAIQSSGWVVPHLYKFKILLLLKTLRKNCSIKQTLYTEVYYIKFICKYSYCDWILITPTYNREVLNRKWKGDNFPRLPGISRVFPGTPLDSRYEQWNCESNQS
jgi:hypothetical protein